MFDVKSLVMTTEVRCQSCRASLTIESDSRPLITRTVAKFEEQHHCRNFDHILKKASTPNAEAEH